MTDELLRCRKDPIYPGISIGHSELQGGTLTAIVQSADAEPLALSCLHVLQRRLAEPGAVVVQPGRRDRRIMSQDRIGYVRNGFIGLDGDASVCSITFRSFDNQPPLLNIAPKHVTEVGFGDRVVKVGRTTGLTIGRVHSPDLVKPIRYGGHIGTIRVRGFTVEKDESFPTDGELSEAGDSGAPYYRFVGDSVVPELVGIHTTSILVNGKGRVAFACHAGPVFRRLEINLV